MRREEQRTGRIADMDFQFDGGHRHRQLANEDPQSATGQEPPLRTGGGIGGSAQSSVGAKSRAARRDS